MGSENDSMVERLVCAVPGPDRGRKILSILIIEPQLLDERGEDVSRAAFAMALNILLLDDILHRVPSAATYVSERVAGGHPLLFDHGALRTVRFPEGSTGRLPAGADAFARILEPLGYRVAGTYPLPRLRMTGRAWCHLDHPETIPQFFVSELHAERFDADFGLVAKRVFGKSNDPLTDDALLLLGRLEREGKIPFQLARQSLPSIAAAFGRHHPLPTLADYEALRQQSAEAAWIATEGNSFNHATDRVPDVEALAARLKANGHPVKDKVEVSANGRVRQTALKADLVERHFADGAIRMVPGSFHEFISRDIDPATGQLDLTFDSGNATGIFQMTRAETGSD